MSNDILIPESPLNPTTQTPLYPAIYSPRFKAEFLAEMLRSLAIGEFALFQFGEGSHPERLLDSIAQELELLDQSYSEIASRAVAESAYRAFEDPLLFPHRFPATYAHGSVRVQLNFPSLSSTVFPVGTLFSTLDGRTAISTAQVVLAPGQSSATIEVQSEVRGAAGNLPAASLVALSIRSAQGVVVSNARPISGGRDPETDAEIKLRFGNFIESRATGNRKAVLSAATNASVNSGAERVLDSILVFPWQLRDVNAEMSYGYAVIDNGSGGASSALLSAAQTAVDSVVSFGQQARVVPASAFVVALSAVVTVRRRAIPTEVDAALRGVWTSAALGQKIEDGYGRGLLPLFDLQAALDRAHPDIVTVKILSHSFDLQPPLGARIVEGATQFDLRVGVVF